MARTSRDEATDPGSELLLMLEQRLSSADYASAEQLVKQLRAAAGAQDDPEPFTGQPQRPAQDARPRLALDSRDPAVQFQALRLALDECEPHVGAIHDKLTGADVYVEALERLGAHPGMVHSSALPLLFRNAASARNSGGTGTAPSRSAGPASAFARTVLAGVRVL